MGRLKLIPRKVQVQWFGAVDTSTAVTTMDTALNVAGSFIAIPIANANTLLQYSYENLYWNYVGCDADYIYLTRYSRTTNSTFTNTAMAVSGYAVDTCYAPLTNICSALSGYVSTSIKYNTPINIGDVSCSTIVVSGSKTTSLTAGLVSASATMSSVDVTSAVFGTNYAWLPGLSVGNIYFNGAFTALHGFALSAVRVNGTSLTSDTATAFNVSNSTDTNTITVYDECTTLNNKSFVSKTEEEDLSKQVKSWISDRTYAYNFSDGSGITYGSIAAPADTPGYYNLSTFNGDSTIMYPTSTNSISTSYSDAPEYTTMYNPEGYEIVDVNRFTGWNMNDWSSSSFHTETGSSRPDSTISNVCVQTYMFVPIGTKVKGIALNPRNLSNSSVPISTTHKATGDVELYNSGNNQVRELPIAQDFSMMDGDYLANWSAYLGKPIYGMGDCSYKGKPIEMHLMILNRRKAKGVFLADLPRVYATSSTSTDTTSTIGDTSYRVYSPCVWLSDCLEAAGYCIDENGCLAHDPDVLDLLDGTYHSNMDDGDTWDNSQRLMLTFMWVPMIKLD